MSLKRLFFTQTKSTSFQMKCFFHMNRLTLNDFDDMFRRQTEFL